jgi:hypothetical protein
MLKMNLNKRVDHYLDRSLFTILCLHPITNISRPYQRNNVSARFRSSKWSNNHAQNNPSKWWIVPLQMANYLNYMHVLVWDSFPSSNRKSFQDQIVKQIKYRTHILVLEPFTSNHTPSQDINDQQIQIWYVTSSSRFYFTKCICKTLLPKKFKCSICVVIPKPFASNHTDFQEINDQQIQIYYAWPHVKGSTASNHVISGHF